MLDFCFFFVDQIVETQNRFLATVKQHKHVAKL